MGALGQLPFAVAIVAGMLAAVNPCGFAMLPGYVAFLLGTGESDGAAPAAPVRLVGRALAVTAAMTLGFGLVFLGFGLAVAPLAVAVDRFLPWVTIVIGIVLLVLGAWLAAGGRPRMLALHPRPGRPRRSLRWAAGYGVAFAVASLSCTIGPFLALTSVAMSTASLPGVLLVFAVYAAGMGLVIGVLTVATALARDVVAHAMRRALPWVNRAGGALLVLAGAYVAWYGVAELRAQASGARDPVVAAVTAVQGAVTRALSALGPGWIAVVLLGLAGVAVLVTALVRMRKGRRVGSETTLRR